jgi:bifunctional non-homologous end joining protein LigD
LIESQLDGKPLICQAEQSRWLQQDRGVYHKRRLQYVGHTVTGFSGAWLKDLFGKLTPYFTEKCPFTPKPKANAPVKWVEPRFVCEVAFQEWTRDGKMRAPSFPGLRDDKDPEEVLREN